ERIDRSDVSCCGEQNEHSHAVCFFCGDDGGAVLRGAGCISRDQGADAGAVAAQADAGVVHFAVGPATRNVWDWLHASRPPMKADLRDELRELTPTRWRGCFR